MTKPYKRGPDGKFVKGTAGGGRKSREVEEDLLAQFKAAITPEEMEAITKKLVSESKKGNMSAIKILFSYLFGLPRQAIEVDAYQVVTVEYVNDWR